MQHLVTKKLYTLSFSLFITTVFILINKIDTLTDFRFLDSANLFYILFLSILLILLFLWERNKLNTKIFLLTTLPTQISLFAGIHLTENLHYIFNLLVGTWFIILGLFIIQKANQAKSLLKIQKTSSRSNMFKTQNIILLSIIICLHLFFSFYGANHALYVDEKLWTYSKEKRIETYWDNIFEQDWKNTRPSDKPGVTLAMISGIGLLHETPSSFLNMEENHYSQSDFLQMLFVMRIPIILFSTLSLLLFYYIISKLFNPTTSLISTAFIGLSPILIGIGRIINPDAFTWIFIPLTLLSYFLYNRSFQRKYLYLTGLLLGLSILTKYIANILIVFFLIEIFIQAILLKIPKQKLPTFLKNKSLDFIIIIILALITFYLFYPGVWMKLDRLLLGTLFSQAFLPVWKPFIIFIFLFTCDQVFFHSSVSIWLILKLQKLRKFILISVPILFLAGILLTLLNTYTGMSIFDFEFFLSSPKSSGDGNLLGVVLSGFYGLIFSIHFLILTGIFITLLFSIKFFSNIQNKKLSTEKYIVFQILLFTLIYYIASSFSEVVPILRYQIILYPLIMLIASVGYIYIFQNNKHANNIFLITTLLIITTSGFSLFLIQPHFFSYNSNLLPKNYIVNPKDLGDGNYEIAQYLNELPNATKLKIWSDKNGICNMFIGTCFSVENLDDFILHGPNYDYFVISKGREAKLTRLTQERMSRNPNFKFRLDKLYSANDILYEINPGNRPTNFLRILDGQSIDILNN